MPVKILCSCGKSMQVKDDLAGKKVKCTGCGKMNWVDDEDDEKPAAKSARPPVKAKRTRDDDYDDDEEEDEPRKPSGVKEPRREERAPPPQAKPGKRTRDDDYEDEDDEEEPRKPAKKASETARPPGKANGKPASKGRAKDEEEERPRKRRGRGRDQDDEEENDEDGEESASSSKGLYIGLAIGGVAALVLVVVGGLFMFSGPSQKAAPPVVEAPPPPVAQPIQPPPEPPPPPPEPKKEEVKEQPKPPPKEYSDFAYIPQHAGGFVFVRVGDVWQLPAFQNQFNAFPQKAELEKTLQLQQASLGLSVSDVQSLLIFFGDFKSKEIWFLLNCRKPIDRDKLAKQIDPQIRKNGELTVFVSDPQKTSGEMAICFLSDQRILVTTDETNLQTAIKSAENPPLIPPFDSGVKLASSRNHHLVVATKVPPELEPLLSKFGREVDAIRNITDIQLAASLDSTIKYDLTLSYAESNHAEVAVKTLQAAQEAASKKILSMPKTVADSLGAAQVSSNLTDVNLKGSLQVDMQEWLNFKPRPPIKYSSSDEAASHVNMKQLGAAILGFHAKYGRLPPQTIRDPKNKALLSWRVALLESLGEEELAKQIKFNEPWNSAHNKTLWDKMPKVFELPGSKAGVGETYYQVFVGPYSAFPPQSAVPLQAFMDGPATTILVVEAASPTNWMKPSDIDVPALLTQKKDPTTMLGNHWNKNFAYAVFADGNARRVPRQLPWVMLNALLTPSGREPISVEQVEAWHETLQLQPIAPMNPGLPQGMPVGPGGGPGALPNMQPGGIPNPRPGGPGAGLPNNRPGPPNLPPNVPPFNPVPN